MSLLEDVLDLLQNVLEYFGVPPDMLVPVWENKLCGQYRSLVRMIGSNLPLTPSPRYHFQIPLHTSHPYGHCDATLDTHPAIPSLADVLWVTEDEGDSFSTIRHCVRWSQRGGGVSLGDVAVPIPPAPGGAGLAGNRARPRGVPVERGSDPVALRKITALEDELLKLRAQIAMIVTAPMSDRPQNIVGTPVTAPVLTSTPRCPPPPPPGPPPPGPPPPGPPPPGPPPTRSHVGPTDVGDLIRQRKEARKGHVQGKGHPAGLGVLLQPQDESAGPLPSMLDVLKDLNQVKLRSVERSPGGTPVRTQRRKATVCAGDPAAMIAEALKRKFTHHRLNDSYDKENCSAELSPFGSPDVSPCVPQHFRRSQGRLHM
ncbi:mitochondrial fission regulator 2 [Esox lucius]|uniref:Mitochondrial fission regulator n=1 Tax=Esox lucius TaxID=8010 RepID=A0A3P8XPA1_ESOLU|nr:mitochondrial fission regulator 2 [Esox lucius]